MRVQSWKSDKRAIKKSPILLQFDTSNKIIAIWAEPIKFYHLYNEHMRKIDNRCEMQLVVFLIVKNLRNKKKGKETLVASIYFPPKKTLHVTKGF